jgi:hypothetical protein
VKWIKVDDMPGFSGAEAAYRSGIWLLVHWDHEKCRGWHLYYRQKWVMNAGAGGLDWSDKQAMAWATTQITTLGGSR